MLFHCDKFVRLAFYKKITREEKIRKKKNFQDLLLYVPFRTRNVTSPVIYG